MRRRCLLILTMLLGMSGVAFAGQEIIAVAANGETPEASVSSRLGWAPFILFFDADGRFMEVFVNPGKDGLTVAGFLAEKGATVIVAEWFGPRIVEVLKGKGIRAVTLTGSAQVAVKGVLRGK
jgi:predicted Fe-Mo cluster-binding NifX family protein